MLLQSLPDALRWILLFVIGTSLGALINLCIYRLAFYVNRNISPWSAPPSPDRARRFIDYLPVIGWLFLRKESDVFGRGFWVRPLLIELSSGIGIIWFWSWNMQGGLYGGPTTTLVTDQLTLVSNWNLGWFVFHTALIALMMIATFIDFDEQLIPDWVTIPGCLFALTAHIIFPTVRLPFTEPELLATRLGFLNYWSPGAMSDWHETAIGLATSIGILMMWYFLLLPKTLTWKGGVRRGLQLMLASILRPPRLTESRIERISDRRMFTETKVYTAIICALIGLSIGVYLWDAIRWTALFDALLGLAMGGGIIWAVRIIASAAIGEEAMGLGDVTLMAMIGAFLGWQAALLTFVLAPFASILVAFAQMVSKRENRLAFGPYLCFAALVVLVGWDSIWNGAAADGVFAIGGAYLTVMIFACLGLMAIMLGGWRFLKKQVQKS